MIGVVGSLVASRGNSYKKTGKKSKEILKKELSNER